MAAQTWRLVRQDSSYKVVISQVGGTRRLRKAILLHAAEAEKWVRHMMAIRVPLIPEAPKTCDGSYFTYIYRNGGVELQLRWHNVAPKGVEMLDSFTDWLWTFIPPDWQYEADDLALKPW